MPETPEQRAGRQIDAQLSASGWIVQDKKAIDFNAGAGIAVREYQTDIGPADYVLFVDKQAFGVIEAKKGDLGQNITTVEDQTGGYGNAKLKWIKNHEPLPFLYEATGELAPQDPADEPAAALLARIHLSRQSPAAADAGHEPKSNGHATLPKRIPRFRKESHRHSKLSRDKQPAIQRT